MVQMFFKKSIKEYSVKCSSSTSVLHPSSPTPPGSLKPLLFLIYPSRIFSCKKKKEFLYANASMYIYLYINMYILILHKSRIAGSKGIYKCYVDSCCQIALRKGDALSDMAAGRETGLTLCRGGLSSQPSVRPEPP